MYTTLFFSKIVLIINLIGKSETHAEEWHCLGSFQNADPNSVGLGQDRRVCVSNKLSGNAHTAGRGVFHFQDTKLRKVVLLEHLGDVRKIQ